MQVKKFATGPCWGSPETDAIRTIGPTIRIVGPMSLSSSCHPMVVMVIHRCLDGHCAQLGRITHLQVVTHSGQVGHTPVARWSKTQFRFPSDSINFIGEIIRFTMMKTHRNPPKILPKLPVPRPMATLRSVFAPCFPPAGDFDSRMLDSSSPTAFLFMISIVNGLTSNFQYFCNTLCCGCNNYRPMGSPLQGWPRVLVWITGCTITCWFIDKWWCKRLKMKALLRCFSTSKHASIFT